MPVEKLSDMCNDPERAMKKQVDASSHTTARDTTQFSPEPVQVLMEINTQPRRPISLC